MRRTLVVAAAMLFVVACSDEGPVSGPGTLTATVVGPNAAEGGALVTLAGDGVGAITAIGGTEVFARTDAGLTRVVLINAAGGELSFQVAVADTTQPPAAVIEEVAGPDDELREGLDDYALEYSR